MEFLIFWYFYQKINCGKTCGFIFDIISKIALGQITWTQGCNWFAGKHRILPTPTDLKQNIFSAFLTFHPKVILGFSENLPSAAVIPVSTDTLVYLGNTSAAMLDDPDKQGKPCRILRRINTRTGAGYLKFCASVNMLRTGWREVKRLDKLTNLLTVM